MITADGTGAWNGDDAKSGTAANPSYNRQAFKLLRVDGKARPRIELGNGAGMFSYLNKKLTDAQIKELPGDRELPGRARTARPSG